MGFSSMEKVTEKIEELGIAAQAFVDASERLADAHKEMRRTVALVASTAAATVRSMKEYHSEKLQEIRSLEETILKLEEHSAQEECK